MQTLQVVLCIRIDKGLQVEVEVVVTGVDEQPVEQVTFGLSSVQQSIHLPDQLYI